MADQQRERDPPAEATPPHVDDSPEMVNQPSPPEEQRITSSSDRQSAENAGAPEDQRVSSTSDEPNPNVDEARPANEEPRNLAFLLGENEAMRAKAASSPSEQSPSPDPSPEMENQSQEPVILLAAPPALPGGDEAGPSTAGEAVIHAGQVGAVQAIAEAGLAIAMTGGQSGPLQGIVKGTIQKNFDPKSEDSNQEFGVDSSPGSKTSDENVDLESDSSQTGYGQERGSETGATEYVGEGSDPSPKIVIIDDENSLTAGSNTNVKSELSLARSDAAVSDFGTSANENVVLGSKLSPSKTSSASIEKSTSATGISQNVKNTLSPKRKSPSKVDHLSPKRPSPYTSPDKLQKQGEAQMSTLLEDLDIKEIKDKPASSGPISGCEQKSRETEESESRKEEMESESDMEVQEQSSPKEHVEPSEHSKKEDPGMDGTE